MSADASYTSPEFLASVQPIVLVGGKSRRFGRDKLREPWGHSAQTLVQLPIESLRAVFGPRVKLVGQCDPSILPLADGVISDQFPGVGPIGGIASALNQCPGPIFVLAGDMPNVSPHDVRRILSVAEHSNGASAALAATDRVHPCAGVYFQAALPTLRDRIRQGAHRLNTALSDRTTICVPVSSFFAANVNLRSDLGSPPGCGRP